MKQFLLMCDENAKEDLENVLHGLIFLEVQGVNLDPSGKTQLLATPVHPPVAPVFMAPPTEKEAPKEDKATSEAPADKTTTTV